GGDRPRLYSRRDERWQRATRGREGARYTAIRRSRRPAISRQCSWKERQAWQRRYAGGHALGAAPRARDQARFYAPLAANQRTALLLRRLLARHDPVRDNRPKLTPLPYFNFATRLDQSRLHRCERANVRRHCLDNHVREAKLRRSSPSGVVDDANELLQLLVASEFGKSTAKRFDFFLEAVDVVSELGRHVLSGSDGICSYAPPL